MRVLMFYDILKNINRLDKQLKRVPDQCYKRLSNKELRIELQRLLLESITLIYFTIISP